MKFKIFTAIFVVMLLLPFHTLAAASDYSLDIPGGFTVGYTEKGLESIAKKTGMDEKALTDYCAENGVILVAVNDDNTEQMRLFCYETELSKKAKSFSALSNEAIAELAGEIGVGEYERVSNGNQVYLKFTEVLADSGGTYTSCQYITVKNSKVYQLSTYNQGETQSDNLKKCFESFKIDEEQSYNTKQKIVIAVVIAAFFILIGIMIFGIIKDLKSQ